MRHNRHKFKLGVDPSHRKSLMRNLAIELIDHGKIKTTQAKCKAVKTIH
jgi:large subunit ribosomal protein L17